MRELLNSMKQFGQANQPPGMRVGRVTSFDPLNYSVKVMLQPELVLTGWLPLVSQWAGNGWGMFSPPTPGDGVNSGDFIVVQYHDGDFDNGVACQQFFNDQNRPLTVPSGEFWLVHKLGASAKLTNDGKLTITDKNGSTVVLGGDGTVTVTCAGALTVNAASVAINANTQINGTLKATGDITDNSGSNTRTVGAMRTQYNNHTHTDPQGGSVGAASPSM